MKIFILEDSEQRIDFFEKTMPNHNLFIAKNVSEAKELFEKNEPFDLIMLDHDLEGPFYTNPDDENTGYQFAKFLKEKENKTLKVIHSVNRPASQKMQGILHNVYYVSIWTIQDEWRDEKKTIVDIMELYL